MIFQERTITIANNNASIDEQVVLYKGDRNVEIQFIIKNSPFKYKSGLESTYGQLIINRKNADSLFSNVSKLSNGKVLFIITGDMIDELNECGDYEFQIRLFNEEQTSRVTLAPVKAGITIREPICEGDEVIINKGVPYLEVYFELNTKNKTYYLDLFSDYSGETLDVSDLDTSNVTSMRNMFSWCTKLTSLDVSNFDTSNVTDMANMFNYCSKITTLDLSGFDVGKVTDMMWMFNGCTSLTSLDLSGWNIGSETKMGGAFSGCGTLVDFKAPQNISVEISVNTCFALSHDSLMNIINNLATVTSTKKLELGVINLAKLTDEEKAIATNKGWTLA